MGKAMIVQSQEKQERPVLERKAGIRVVDAAKVEKSTEQDDSETPSMALIEPNKATIVYKATAEPEENESREGGDSTSEEGKETVEIVLPEKFKGKTMNDVVRSYKELESL